MLLYGSTVLLYSLEYWIAGCFSILMGLLYASYLAVWKLDFDTETGEFHYRALFIKEQGFHVDEIREFYPGGSHNPLLILRVRRLKIHIPWKLAEPLREYYLTYRLIKDAK